MISTNRPHQLKTLLGSVQDPKVDSEKSEIYQITRTDCEKSYVGQTRRLITTRLNEHIREANQAKGKSRSTQALKSLVAKHIMKVKHTITEDNLRVIKEVNEFRKLDPLGS